MDSVDRLPPESRAGGFVRKRSGLNAIGWSYTFGSWVMNLWEIISRGSVSLRPHTVTHQMLGISIAPFGIRYPSQTSC